MQRPGRVQSRDRLLNEVWGYESVIDTRTVDTHVRRLREKLGKAAGAIETVRGFGYRLRESQVMVWLALALASRSARGRRFTSGGDGSSPGVKWKNWSTTSRRNVRRGSSS